ncbi:MAG TPA: GNAT family N-acetyltransferase [Fimbriimonadaceae bacterium]|nr:GNAT family N-acetyltransferase [Fimbriimonadaceae bacterium]
MEIRPIEHHEADEFLHLLCDVFELDFQRASAVFYTEPFFDLQRKWALLQGGVIRSILTTTPLHFGWGTAYGIAGVATDRRHRRCGLAGILLREVMRLADPEHRPLLFAADPRLYQSLGFVAIDEVVRGELNYPTRLDQREPLPPERVRELYDRWACEDPERLIRDDLRWRTWGWSLRCCEPFSSGYLCQEVTVVREAVLPDPQPYFPVPPSTDWVGLRSLTRSLDIPVGTLHAEMFLMGIGWPRPPQMFMTDQF